MKHKILLLETIADAAMKLLEGADDVTIFTGFEPDALQQVIGNEAVDAIITRGKGQVNEALISAFPDLKVVTRCGVGLDNIDVAFATTKGVKVVHAPGANSATIAEHTIALILALQRNLYRSINEVKAGNWDWRKEFQGDEIGGKTLGILGLGNIGKRVAKIAEAMNMTVIYWDMAELAVPYDFLSLREILQTADIISVHVPLTTETADLIDAEKLKLVKPSAILINTARGEIIDQQAVARALTEKNLAGFGADVLAYEPPRPEEVNLIKQPNALITAHVGSLTATTYTNMCVETVSNTLKILREESPDPIAVFNRNDLHNLSPS